jgi:hypothetical protein
MGHVRRLTAEQKEKVAAIREKSGYRKAIAEAKKLGKFSKREREEDHFGGAPCQIRFVAEAAIPGDFFEFSTTHGHCLVRDRFDETQAVAQTPDADT